MNPEIKVCVVIGAAGRLGRLLVDRAVLNNRHVRAVVRPDSTYETQQANVTVHRVDLTDTSAMREVFTGADVVFCTIRSSSSFKNTRQMSRHVGQIIDALVDDDGNFLCGVERFILCSCISTTDTGKSKMAFGSRMNHSIFLRGHVQDFTEMEKGFDENASCYINNVSYLNYTLVKPTVLTTETVNADTVEFNAHTSDEPKPIQTRIPREAVAIFMYDRCYEKEEWSNSVVELGLKPPRK